VPERERRARVRSGVVLSGIPLRITGRARRVGRSAGLVATIFKTRRVWAGTPNNEDNRRDEDGDATHGGGS